MVVKNEGCTITYTPVGSIYVARTMRSLIEDGNEVVFGGEGNGGLIFPDHQFCRDGGMTAAMMVFILASTGQQLSTLINALPKRSMIKDKISTSRGTQVLESLKQSILSGFTGPDRWCKNFQGRFVGACSCFRYRTHNSDYYRFGFS